VNPEGEDQTPDVTPDVTPSETEAPAGWGGPSEDEWKTVVGGLSYLTDQISAFGQETEPEFDPKELENMDAAEIVEHYVSSRMSELEPYVATAAREAGEKRMNEIFDTVEPETGKFDRKVAGKLAEAMYGEVGDPVEAVKVAARMVAGLSKSERDAALREYKDSLKRSSFQDPGVSGAGERSQLPAKTYDEVIARWSGQEDV
jgi:hypothetical protein